MSQIIFRRNKAPKLSRRSFLAGSGACISLPLLEAMLPSGKMAFAADASPGRMLIFFTGNGCHMPKFVPGSEGDFSNGFRGATSLDPLRDIWQDVTTIKGLHNDPLKGQIGDHGKGSGAFMTCAAVAKNRISSHTTMDVVAARQIANQTRFSNLHLGLDGVGSGFPDNGYSAAYLGNISWQNSSTPVPKEIDPNKLFNRIFSGDLPDVPGGADTANAINRSVLDAVLGDVNRLENKLGVADREKLQGYLNGIHELEQKLQAPDEEQQQSSACAKPNIGSNGNWVKNSRLMNDLMVMAFTCDLTRVISYVFSNGLTGRVYNNLGIGGGHHNISHHGGNGTKNDQLRRIDTYHMGELADLCKKLKAQVDVQGNSLLDSTIVFYSSEIADGNTHSHYNLPTVLVGRGNGRIRSGRHINTSSGKMADLYVAMMQHVGANVDSFGNSSGPLNLS